MISFNHFNNTECYYYGEDVSQKWRNFIKPFWRYGQFCCFYTSFFRFPHTILDKTVGPLNHPRAPNAVLYTHITKTSMSCMFYYNLGWVGGGGIFKSAKLTNKLKDEQLFVAHWASFNFRWSNKFCPTLSEQNGKWYTVSNVAILTHNRIDRFAQNVAVACSINISLLSNKIRCTMFYIYILFMCVSLV